MTTTTTTIKITEALFYKFLVSKATTAAIKKFMLSTTTTAIHSTSLHFKHEYWYSNLQEQPF